MSSIDVIDLSKRFAGGGGIGHLSLNIPAGKLTCLVGPSGSGKTTLLRVLAGLLTPDEGDIRSANCSILHLGAKDRNVSMVFQSPRLLPHLSVAANIAMPLTIRDRDFLALAAGSVPRSRLEHVNELARSLRIDHLLNRKPNELSGGEAQRVSLARALIVDASLYLFDEPLSSVDEQQRAEFSELLVAIMQDVLKKGCPVIYVTHDLDEARSIGDLMVVLMDGLIAQTGNPRTVFECPRTVEVAEFFSPSGLLRYFGTVERVTTDRILVRVDNFASSLEIPTRNLSLNVGASVILAFRQVHLAADQDRFVVGSVRSLHDLGDRLRVRALIDDRVMSLKAIRSTNKPHENLSRIAVQPDDAIVIPALPQH